MAPNFSFIDKKKTEWQFAIIPLGGFVKFYGDDSSSFKKTNILTSNTHNLVQFDKASVVSRFFTVLAGPLANFLFSIFIFSLLILIQGISVKDPIVGKINKFYEEKYDLRVNDKILKVEGKEVKSFSEIFSYINEPQKNHQSSQLKEVLLFRKSNYLT